MNEYWFDLVSGSDSNSGTYQSPKKGVSTPIRDFLVSGNAVNVKRGSIYSWANGSSGQNLNKTDVGGWVLRAYGDSDIPPTFDGFQVVATGEWSLHAGNVWKRVVANTAMIQRVFIGSEKYEVFESPNRNGGAAGITGASSHWYWAKDVPSVGQSTLYMWSGSGSVNPTDAYGSVSFMDSSTFSFGGIVGEFTRCHDIEIDGIRFGAATANHIRLRSCNNVLLKNVTFYYMPLYAATLRIYDDALGASSGSIEALNLNMTWGGRKRAYRAAATGASNDDPNGAHDSGGSACVMLQGAISQATFRGGVWEGGTHTGFENYSYATDGKTGAQNYTVDNVTIISAPNDIYGRAFGVAAHASGGAGTVLIENCRFVGQKTRSQITGGKTTVRNCVFSSSISDFGNGFSDYYSTIKTHDKANTAQQLVVQSYSGEIPLDTVLIEGNVFVDNRQCPVAAEFYDGEPDAGLIVIKDNIFNQSSGTYWQHKPRLFERRTSGSWVPVLTGNKWGAGWTEKVGLFDGASWAESDLSVYGSGNARDDVTAKKWGPVVRLSLRESPRIALTRAS